MWLVFDWWRMARRSILEASDMRGCVRVWVWCAPVWESRACACRLGCLPRGRVAETLAFTCLAKSSFPANAAVFPFVFCVPKVVTRLTRDTVFSADAMNKFCKSSLCEIESYVLIGRRVDVPGYDAVRLLVLILISVKLGLCRLDCRPVLGHRECFLDLDGSTSAAEC